MLDQRKVGERPAGDPLDLLTASTCDFGSERVVRQAPLDRLGTHVRELGGLGVREGTLAFLLALFGVNPSDAVTLSFLVYLTRVVVGVFGGIWQLLESILPNTAAYSSHLESDFVDSP